MKKIFAFLLLIVLVSCNTTRTTGSNYNQDDDAMVLDDNEVAPDSNLASYLRRTPGVRLLGSGNNASVQVRGVNSFAGNTSPLFIVNGTDVGTSYSSAADIVRTMKIQSVQVLKGSDATIYGVRGAGGVIVIKTK